VKVNPLDVSNVIGTAGTVQIHDVESLLGRASLRVGTNLSSGNIIWQPFFTASIFHEFAGDVTTTLAPAAAFNPFDIAPATLKTSRVGTYAQFGLGTAAVIGNTGWLGYGRVDYRTGDNIEGISVNAGLRYQFTPDKRQGSLKDDLVQTVHAYNWTGPYIGAFSGATWGDQHAFAPAFGTSSDPDFAGYIIGGQLGYNIQHGRWVIGIEGDYGFANASGGVSCPNAFLFTCGAEVHDLASLTGRLGITSGRALFYAKGGWAAGNVTALTSINTGVPGGVIGETKWLTGWTVGGGMEFALTNNWSARAEYMHYDLGSGTFTVGGPTVIEVDTRGDTVRVGVNYHFQR